MTEPRSTDAELVERLRDEAEDWGPMVGYFFISEGAANEMKGSLEAAADRIEALTEKYNTLSAAVNDSSLPCSPECDSHGHAEDCKYVDMAASMVVLQQRMESLTRERDEARRPTDIALQTLTLSLQRAEAAEARVAVLENDAEALLGAMERMGDDRQTVYVDYVERLRAALASGTPPPKPGTTT